MKNLWFSVGLCTINFLLCGCASTKYQEAYSLSELAKRIDQAPIENKQSASRFIEQQTQYILSLEKNDKVKSQAYISITHPSKLQEKKQKSGSKQKITMVYVRYISMVPCPKGLSMHFIK